MKMTAYQAAEESEEGPESAAFCTALLTTLKSNLHRGLDDPVDRFRRRRYLPEVRGGRVRIRRGELGSVHQVQRVESEQEDPALFGQLELPLRIEIHLIGVVCANAVDIRREDPRLEAGRLGGGSGHKAGLGIKPLVKRPRSLGDVGKVAVEEQVRPGNQRTGLILPGAGNLESAQEHVHQSALRKR